VSERSNVLLVVLDSTRAHNTSLHGYKRETTPFLSEFAGRSTVYTQARAPSIHSIASHVSMFTGTHVEQHRALRHTAQIDTEQTVWHDLSGEGYATGLFTNNRIVSNASNLGDSFETTFDPDYPLSNRLENTLDSSLVQRAYFRTYDGVSRLRETASARLDRHPRLRSTWDGLTSSVAGLTGDESDTESEEGFKTLPGDEFTDAFLAWQADQRGPWAACLNLMDTHSPYRPAPAFDRWADEESWDLQDGNQPSVRDCLTGEGWDRVAALESLYDGTIRQVDAVLAEFVDGLEAQNLLEDTLLIITSDHGEAFGERSRLNPDVRLRGHKWGIHEALTHVPLVVSYPGQTEGRVVDKPVSLTDLPALVRAVVRDGEREEGLASEGPVLASTFRIPEHKRSKYRSVEGIDHYIGPWRAVYEDREDGVRKFAQKGDRYVTVDIEGCEATVLTREPHDRVAAAYDPLSDDDVLTEQQREIDDDLEQQLEDLGYIR
jgi:arylsulfatase A-like enzyme